MKYFEVLRDNQINPPDARYPDLNALAQFKEEKIASGHCAGVVLDLWTGNSALDPQCHCVVLETRGGVKLRDYQRSYFGETMWFEIFPRVKIVSIFGEVKAE
jgi:hypothetical protein